MENQNPIFSPLSGKKGFFLHFLDRFWVEKGIWSKAKGSQSKVNIVYVFNTLRG